jgi:electron transport complex protein RnfC
MGGPMMGNPLGSLDVPVMKGTSGILAFSEKEIDDRASYNCVKCGRCLEACPNFLNPCMLAKLSRAGRIDEMHDYSVADCTLCGSCSFSCPSGIPIAQLIKVAKSTIAQQQRREAKK